MNLVDFVHFNSEPCLSILSDPAYVCKEADNFCYMCGDVIFKSQKSSITGTNA